MIFSSPKKQISITSEKLQKIALYYLGRYEASEKSLKDVLLRRITKAKKQGIDTSNAEEAIPDIISKMREYGYVNDERYAKNKTNELFSKGKSRQNIVQTLTLKGINNEIINKIIASLDEKNNHNTDIKAGINYAKRKKIGPFRRIMAENTIKKELGKMARAGFDYEVAKKIIFAENEEELTNV